MIYSIEVRDLHFRYLNKEEETLKGINLKVKKGEILAIVGLSGNGKSTLCHCISGILHNSYKGDLRGDILLDGRSLKDLKRVDIIKKIGIVFQDPDTQLFSPTVEDEVAFGPENLCLETDVIIQRIDDALKVVGMENYRLSNPNHLSGGQKQLVALASVLSLEPEIFIFDEAMAQVDKAGRTSIKNKIEALKKQGKTIIMIEHDMTNLDITDRVMVLKNGKLQEFKGSL
ncbi:energy-coupling factor ABC transporter ATP-binding protein [Alkaliphilus peptidifermentans]|uniref:Energy-coupling factor transport system ATP-binding protein n=1 Tax=Alkaliphilus peptidifermentans DSM 18978 TaxID=1120976 RepID=A0A1G5GN46_9FIRM|nr:ABC transporter ATP-binding protein [Alkaliphilus peptidifermentans]SCY52108.1 energy-coupling factor transport system ATP-binding protein [Alkaliphilus peptidifermentans DSM 18978]